MEGYSEFDDEFTLPIGYAQLVRWCLNYLGLTLRLYHIALTCDDMFVSKVMKYTVDSCRKSYFVTSRK